MSFENVVLQYPHPHIVVYVEDNSGYAETFLEEEAPVRMIQAGLFAQGRDNKLVYCASYDEFISEFGEPNYKLYGQPAYNVARALKTGYAGAYVIRVMPDDATFANAIVMIRYKVLTDDDGKKSLSVSYSSQTVEGATSKTDLEEKMRELAIADPDDDGYYTRPLFCVYSAGRGAYGNNTRFRIADITDYENTYGSPYRNYRLDVLRMETTLVRKEYAYGSFDQDLFDSESKESLYLEDLVNDEVQGLGKARIIINDEIYQEILDVYNTQVLSPEEEPETISTFDIIYGRTMKGEENPHIKFEPSADEVTFTAETDGISLFSGTDGSFEIGNPGRDQVIEDQLVKAYSGELDRFILSTYSTPADFMLDANFPEPVKRQMAALAMRREYDATLYLDCGLLDTTNECVYWLQHMKDISDPNILKELHHYKHRDTEYTGKAIDVTTTYFLAGLIPTHFKEIGLGIPMAMANARTDYSEVIPGSFKPVIDPDDNDIKKVLYNYRGNYYETVRYNVFQRGVANNTQVAITDRMDEFNNYVVNLAVQTARSIMYGHLYNFAEPADRARYQTQTNRVFEDTLGRFVRSCTIEYEMTKNDEKKNILRLKIRIVFKTVVKRGIVEVYLDPRVTD